MVGSLETFEIIIVLVFSFCLLLYCTLSPTIAIPLCDRKKRGGEEEEAMTRSKRGARK